jgi:hypothetical protein
MSAPTAFVDLPRKLHETRIQTEGCSGTCVARNGIRYDADQTMMEKARSAARVFLLEASRGLL